MTTIKATKVMAQSTLASAVTNVATSLAVATGEGARFDAISGGSDHYYLLVIDTNESPPNNFEVMKATALAGDTFTVERGKEGTTGIALPVTPGNPVNKVRVLQAITPQTVKELISAEVGAGRAEYTIQESGALPAAASSGTTKVFARPLGAGSLVGTRDDAGMVHVLDSPIQTLADADTALDAEAGRTVEQTPTADRTITLPSTNIGAGRQIAFFNLSADKWMILNASGGGFAYKVPGGGSVVLVAGQDAPTLPGHWKVEARSLIHEELTGGTPGAPSDWVCPQGVHHVDVLLFAAGGGGGGGNANAGGSAGGGGAIIDRRRVPVTPGTTYQFYVGTKGTGGNANWTTPTHGTDGGDTKFGDFVAGGGEKGLSGAGAKSGGAKGTRTYPAGLDPVLDLLAHAGDGGDGGASNTSNSSAGDASRYAERGAPGSVLTDNAGGAGGGASGGKGGDGGDAGPIACNAGDGSGPGAGGGGAGGENTSGTAGDGADGAIYLDY